MNGELRSRWYLDLHTERPGQESPECANQQFQGELYKVHIMAVKEKFVVRIGINEVIEGGE